MSEAGNRQLPLALRYPPDQRLDTFVGAPAGAIAQLRAWAEDPGSDWLYLAGPPGSGKTHLSLAACAAAEAAGRRPAYLPLKSAPGRLKAALADLDAPLLVLDGLEAVAGNRDDEIALFDAHNRLRAAGAAVLYTAMAAPDALALALPDLRSRLGLCTRLTLAPLDEDARRQVLAARASRRGLVLDDAALDWLFARLGRDLGTLTAALDRLDRASLAAQRRITVAFLRREFS
jgi:DnaA family protein